MYTKQQQLNNRQKKAKKDRSQRKKMIKQLDALVTQIVQKRDKHCVTCGKNVGLYCGHFHSRTHYGTRWDLMNCHAQCNPCNLRHEADPFPYTRFMLRRYSIQALDDLYQRHRNITKYKTADLEEIKEQLQTVLEELL